MEVPDSVEFKEAVRPTVMLYARSSFIKLEENYGPLSDREKILVSGVVKALVETMIQTHMQTYEKYKDVPAVVKIWEETAKFAEEREVDRGQSG